MRSMTSARPVGFGVRITPPPLRVVIAVEAMPIPPYFERLPEVAFAREPLLRRRPLPDVDFARLRDEDDDADFDLDVDCGFAFVRPPLDFCLAVARRLCSSSSSSSSAYSSSSSSSYS